MIRQRNFRDCCICSLAMFLDTTYEEVQAVINVYARRHEIDISGGITDYDSLNIIQFYGKEAKTKRFSLGQRWALDKTLSGRKALLGLPSQNFAGLNHCVYWNGKRIIDPSNLGVYQNGRLTFLKVRNAIIEEIVA